MDINPSDASKSEVKNHTIIHIGVTGHRKLENIELLRKSVQKVLYLINEILKAKMKNIRYTFNVISPLAEGADRLIVKEVMEWQMLENEDTSSLEVVLPFSKDDYIRDFETDKSKDEFEVLLRRALSICTLEKATSREAAYENVGHYIVDNSDFLIAIWNGESAVGKGGTGDIVEYARRVERHSFWINSENGSIKEENREK